VKGGKIFWAIGIGAAVFLIATNQTEISFMYRRFMEAIKGILESVLGRY
jgi:hypothetical protein